MRLIDADELLKNKVSNAYISRFEIENAPTIDAEPVVYGHWDLVDSDLGYRQLRCSECSYERCVIDSIKNPIRCESCGAKMDEVKENDI